MSITSILVAPVATTLELALEVNPEKVNEDPYGDGWLVKIEITEHMVSDGLLSPEDYELLLR